MRRFVLSITIAIVAVPAYAYRIAAWIPAWDSASLTSIQTNADKLTESNPVWYSLNADGSIAKLWNAEDPTWRSAMTGTEILPTIQNFVNGKFDGLLIASIVDDPARREAHAEALTQLVNTNAFDGIDIDYEAVPATSREGFSSFVTTLAAKLHASNKKLSITVHPKTSDSQNWKGPGSQDWALIGVHADSMKIMAYDYSWTTSAAGPIAPLDWLDKVAAYAMSVVPGSKVIMGLPWYGYDWVGTSGKGVTYKQATELALAQNATLSRDANGEVTFSYADHTVYFQDAESYRRKVDALVQKHPALGGFTHWRTGAEDPEIWNKVAELGNSSGSGATATTGSFSVNGPELIEADRGSTASASFSLVAIDGFDGVVDVVVESLDAVPATLTLDRSQVRPGETATLLVSVAAAAAAIDYRVRLLFKSGSLVQEQIVTVRVFMTQSSPAKANPRKRSGRG